MPAVISHKHRFIFIHVPKVAGTSVARALAPYEDFHWLKRNLRRTLRRIMPAGKAGPLLARLGTGIIQAAALRQSMPDYDRYFSFAFVRNPWDLHVSFYHYVRRDRFHPRHKNLRTMSFEDYVTAEVMRSPFLQCKYVTDGDGKVIVNFLGRYESLAKDFDEICRRLGIDAALPHLNPSQRRTYESYYTDETRAIVASVCRPDIELFNYTF